MLQEWPLTELTLFFTGLKMDKAHFPGAGAGVGGSQNIDDGGGGPTGWGSYLEKTHWISLPSTSQNDPN